MQNHTTFLDGTSCRGSFLAHDFYSNGLNNTNTFYVGAFSYIWGFRLWSWDTWKVLPDFCKCSSPNLNPKNSMTCLCVTIETDLPSLVKRKTDLTFLRLQNILFHSFLQQSISIELCSQVFISMRTMYFLNLVKNHLQRGVKNDLTLKPNFK